jgi:predicted RNase H-like HicB family nuclease
MYAYAQVQFHGLGHCANRRAAGVKTMAHPLSFKFSVLLVQEDGDWVAQCLEYDVAAQGNSISEAKEALAQTIAGQIVVALEHEEQPFQGIPPAPKEYWDKFHTGERLADREPIFIPPAYMINAMQDDVRISA